jgi:hypothetical protein
MANGATCSSPALRDEDFCDFHRATRDRIRRQRIAAERKLPLQLPILDDADTIQLAITDVVNALLADRIDQKKAALILYALQTAAIDAKRTSFGEARNSYQEYSPEFDPGLPELEEEIETPEEELPEKKPAASASEEDVIEEIQAWVQERAQKGLQEWGLSQSVEKFRKRRILF